MYDLFKVKSSFPAKLLPTPQAFNFKNQDEDSISVISRPSEHVLNQQDRENAAEDQDLNKILDVQSQSKEAYETFVKNNSTEIL